MLLITIGITVSVAAVVSASRFELLQKDSIPRENYKEPGETTKDKEEETIDFSRIRCPHCRWQPKFLSRWFCADAGFPEFYFNGCGAMWNTFATGGVCVGCRHRWRWTTCLRCGQWARHEDWYAEKSD